MICCARLQREKNAWQNPDKIHKYGKPGQRGKTKDRVQMRGDALRQTRARPAKGGQTRQTKDKGAKAKQWTQSWQRLGQSQTIDPDKGRQRADRERTTSGQSEDKERTHGGHQGQHGRHKVWRRGQSGHKRIQGGHSAGGHMADTWQTRAGKHKAERTQGGHMANLVWRRSHSRHKADTRIQVGYKVGTRQTQGGQMADTWRTRFGGAAKAETRRTHGGQALLNVARAYRGQPFFFLRENPTANCLGKNQNQDASVGTSSKTFHRFAAVLDCVVVPASLVHSVSSYLFLHEMIPLHNSRLRGFFEVWNQSIVAVHPAAVVP